MVFGFAGPEEDATPAGLREGFANTQGRPIRIGQPWAAEMERLQR
jgi:hypothetical protein